jgi:Tol biopolymer transport system component
VAFRSAATNLVPGDDNGQPDIFIKDLDTGALHRIGGADGASEAPALTAEGRYVGFQSRATDLVTPDTNAAPDILRGLNALTQP